MKMTLRCLRQLVRESIEGREFLRERPWSVEYKFSMHGSSMEDSSEDGADGFAVILRSESGREARVVVDSYWNPQAGDQSGNSLKWEVDGDVVDSVHVPVKFDDGSEQVIVVSNSPVKGMIFVSHSPADEVPIVHMAVENPFEDEDDITFDVKTLGNGDVDVEMTGATNI